jgi:hypothetical protein
MGMSWVDAAHLVVAVTLTYLLGFERDLRGAVTGDRVFALVGAGAGVIGIIAAHGAPNVLAGAITGIGFIGGGLVWRQASGAQQVVKGITTAAAGSGAARRPGKPVTTPPTTPPPGAGRRGCGHLGRSRPRDFSHSAPRWAEARLSQASWMTSDSSR